MISAFWLVMSISSAGVYLLSLWEGDPATEMVVLAMLSLVLANQEHGQ